MYIKVFATSFISLLAVASPVEKRTAVDIENDLFAVKSDATTLDNDVLALPTTNLTLGEVFTIHTDFATLDGALEKATTDVENTGPLSDPDATTIATDVQLVEPVIIKTIQDIIARKQALGSFVEPDLLTLQQDFRSFESAFTSVLPPTLLPSITPVIASIDSALATAVAVFAS